MKDVFLDLETLGTRAGSAVIEIGAVLFDRDTGETGTSFHRHVKPAAPFTASIETLQWRQEKGLGPIPTEGMHHRDAVFAFLDWLADEVKIPTTDITFWSWGPMDFTVLEPLLDFRNPEDPMPWEYWQSHDARGFWALAFPGTRHADRPHQALEDAVAGAKDLVAALRELRFGKVQPLLDALDDAESALDWHNTDPEGEHGNPTAVAAGGIKRIRETRLAVTGKEAA